MTETDWIWKLKGLRPAERLVLLARARNPRVTINELERLLSLKERQVRRIFASLRGRSVLEVSFHVRRA